MTDGRHDHWHVARKRFVPDAENLKPLACEKRIALHVVSDAIGVKRAVELDDQLLFDTHEIDDVRSDEILALEFVAVELAVAHRIPEELFHREGLVAHLARA